MAGAIAILRDLHRLRRHIKGLEDEIGRAPRLIKLKQAALVRQEEELKAAHEQLNHMKVGVRQNEGTLKQAHQQIEKWQGQLRDISSKKEYDALQHEMADGRKRCGELEDRILEEMGQAEEQSNRIPELEKALKKDQDDLVQFEKTSRERVAVLTGELKKAQAEMKGVEEQLPPDFRTVYDRQVSARGEDAMSLVKDRTCTACYTGLTEQMFNDLRAGRLVVCKVCGRIIYLAEEV